MKRNILLALRGMAFAVCTMADELLEHMPEEAPADEPDEEETAPEAEGEDAGTPEQDPEPDPENELLLGALAGLSTDDRKELAEQLNLSLAATYAWSKKGHVPEYRREAVRAWFDARNEGSDE